MRTRSARAPFLSGLTIAAALLWGAVEFVALQWSQVRDRLRLFAAQRPA